jgi:uncharacterized membrane protein
MLSCFLAADYFSHSSGLRNSIQYINKSYFVILLMYIVLVLALYHGAVDDSSSIAAAAVFGAIIGFFMFSFHAVQKLSSGWTIRNIGREILWGTGISGIISTIGTIISMLTKF